jgi:uncharacterized protein
MATDRRTIYDPIHGVLTLRGAPLELVGHPAFQRLWAIRQTGFAHLVFPGANHTRLEHSLGVMWVAEQMAERLALPASAAHRVAVGALLHDLGHGPFSHTFDGPMREVLGVTHEAISRAWITSDGPEGSRWSTMASRSIPEILERHGLRPKGVAELVDPGPGPERRDATLRAMLHGAIDADRIDYLQRDAHYTGVAHGAIDAARLLDTAQAHRGRLVFAEKGRSAVEGFLVGRALMYAAVYYHKTVRAAEIMAQGAFERLAGYPVGADRALFGTDGELFVSLQDGGPTSARMVADLEVRRLHKRVYGHRTLTPSERRPWRVLARDPPRRRGVESEAAARLGAPDGSVLIDLAGLDPREPSGKDWAEVGLIDGHRVTHPFRAPSPWRALALQPPAQWAVGVYVDPRYRAEGRRRLPRLLERLV